MVIALSARSSQAGGTATVRRGLGDPRHQVTGNPPSERTRSLPQMRGAHAELLAGKQLREWARWSGSCLGGTLGNLVCSGCLTHIAVRPR
jgi:hypothetical protein